jgi:hypothetical protein
VRGLLDLVARLETREGLKAFIAQNGIPARELAAALKFLFYWFVPKKKPLAELAPPATAASEAARPLSEAGIRSNLDLLQRGIDPAGRRELAEVTGLAEGLVLELVNRADLSRLPWCSKATISNIVGSGYGSLAGLVAVDPAKLAADYLRYGQGIGKNLKLGNEIDSSYRIAKLVPVLLKPWKN